jgi:DNA polymerase III subunit delta'
MIHPVEGHDAERAALAASLAAGTLPPSLLLHGPQGVGRQRVALWLAQLLLCTQPDASGPCGTCHACRLSLRLEHPDLHWFFPLPRPKGVSGPDRLADALEDARAAELAARRTDTLRPTLPDGLSGIFLAHVHVLLRSAASRPAMGRRQVFIVGDAEALVPQESSPEAANALLKLLEEPPPDTTLILTASEPAALLPTIRSRLMPVRLRPLLDDLVADVLARDGADPDEARRAARLGAGSIGRALGFLRRDGEDGPLEALRSDARAVLEAALDRSAANRMAAALARSPAGARGPFSDTLAFLTVWLRDLAAAATGAHDVLVNADAADWLRRQAALHPHAAGGVPQAIAEVEQLQQLTQLNINPQLGLAHLLRLLNMCLCGRTPASDDHYTT